METIIIWDNRTHEYLEVDKETMEKKYAFVAPELYHVMDCETAQKQIEKFEKAIKLLKKVK